MRTYQSSDICPPNEEYVWGGACVTTCSSYNSTAVHGCILISIKKCFCKKGYIRSNGTIGVNDASGDCIRPEEC